MGKKHSGKITNKVFSILAASAVITTQIPAALPGNAAFSVSSAKIDAATDAVLVGADAAVTTTAAAAKATTTAPASTTKAATTTAKAVTTAAAASKINAEPCLSIESLTVPASAAGTKVLLKININEPNTGDAYYYYSPLVYLDMDARLTYNNATSSVLSNNLNNAPTTTNFTTSYNLQSYKTNINLTQSYMYGKNGTFATINVTIPAYAKPGDIFYFNIRNTKINKNQLQVINTPLTNPEASKAIKTADTSSDKYLKDTPYDGYILIDPSSAANTQSAASPYELVRKDSVTYAVYEDHAVVAFGDYNAEKVVIASEINGKKVTEIGSNAFSQCDTKSVTIPDTVVKIGASAFYNCSIESIVIPDSVTSIGEHAFQISALKSVTLPSNITELPVGLFYACQSLTELKLPKGITAIPNNMCSSCKSLKSVEIPDGVTTIGSSAFNDTGLTSVEIPDSVTTLNAYAFSGCKQLESVKLPANLTTISNNVFYYCTALPSLELPDKLESIGRWTFEATQIKELDIPASVKTIEGNSFGSSNIEKINYPDDMEILPAYAFSGASKVKSIKLPSKLTAIPEYAFASCSSLESIEIPKTVTSLGAYAFQNCGIKEFAIPDQITDIKPYAFGDSNITSMVIPERFTELPRCMFYNARALKSVTLPSKLTAIQDYFLYGCSSLTSLDIPDTVTSIGTNAFQNCRITELSLPNNIKTIGNNAFAYSYIESIEIPDSVTELPANTFTNATKLKSIKLPSKLTAIPDGMCLNCSSLTSIDIPETVTVIGPSSFQGCSSLKQIDLPDGVESIGYRSFMYSGVTELKMPTALKTVNIYAFEGSNIESIIYDDSLTTIPANAFGSAPKLKSVKLPSKLTAIPDDAFYYCKNLTSIEIPETVTSIGVIAFYGCEGLTSITLPKNLTAIHDNAFSGTNIKEITIPGKIEILSNSFANSKIEKITLDDSIKAIPNNTFSNAASLKTIVFPSKLETIGDRAFFNCIALKSLDLPDTVTAIGSYAFSSCSALTSIDLPDALTTIGSYAFSNSGIKEITLPASLTSCNSAFINSNVEKIVCSEGITDISAHAFYLNKNLKSVTLPKTLKTIGNNAFDNCTSLTSLDMPDSVTSIGRNAFSSSGIKTIKLSSALEAIPLSAFTNSAIESIEIPGSVKSIDAYAFNNAKSLKSVKINDGVTSISTSAFTDCTSLAEINIPETVTSIDWNTFKGTALKSIVIPDSVTRFNTSSMFENCSALESVTLPQSLETIGNNMFKNCAKLKGVDLPENLKTINNGAFSGTTFTSLYIPATVTSIYANALQNSKIDTIYGYKGTAAEKFAADNNLKFIESDGRIWDKTDSLPTAGKYKLDCDVTVKGNVTISTALDLDLNGHTVIVERISDNGSLTIRDSSKDKTGVMKTSASSELIGVNGKLVLLGGSFYGTEKGNDTATIGFNSNKNSYFELDGATVYSTSSNPLSIRGGSGTINIKSGTLESTYNKDKASYSVHSAIYIYGGYNGTINITGGSIKAGTGAAVYGANSSAILNISGGKFSSEGDYALYCTSKETINLSGDLSFKAKKGGIYVPEGKVLNITGPVTSADVSIYAVKSGTLTNGLSKYVDVSAVSSYLNAINANGKLSINTAGELSIDIPVVTTTTKPATTTKPTTTKATTTTAVTTTTVLPDAKKYQVINVGMTWQEASDYCKKAGGHLAVITSKEEQLQIENLLKAQENPRNSYWLGGIRNADGKFEWITDEAMSYTNWYGSQPDNANGNENALMIYSGRSFGKWNDLKDDCTCRNEAFFGKENFGFICEWDSADHAALTLPVTTTTTKPATTTTTKATTTTAKPTTTTTTKATTTTTAKPTTTTTTKATTTTAKPTTTTTTKATTTTTAKPTTTTTTKATTTTTAKPTTTTTTKATTTTAKPTTTTTTKATTTTTSTILTKPTDLPPVTTVAPPEVEEPSDTDTVVIDGELTVTEMTKDDLIRAGIDLGDDDNYNSFNYSIEAHFGAAGVVFNNYVTSRDTGEIVSNQAVIAVGGNTVFIPDNTFYYVPDLNSYVYHTSTVTEEMYMIIDGTCKWLKEFYDVQLYVINKGTGTISNCEANLNVPTGLTLVNSDKIQHVDDLGPNEKAYVHWYLRGDEEGDYDLSATFKGKHGDEDLKYDFRTKDSLHVYSSSALSMEVVLPGYSYYNKMYNVKIKLKNESNKPIYNLENVVTHFKEGWYAIYSEKAVTADYIETIVAEKKTALDFRGQIAKISVDELAPGETAVLELFLPDLWKSVYEQYIDAERFDANTKRIMAIITQDPNLLAIAPFYTVYEKMLAELPIEHILKSVKVTLSGSNSDVKCKITIDPPYVPKNSVSWVYTNAAQNTLRDIFFRTSSNPLNPLGSYRDNYIYNLDTSKTRDGLSPFTLYLIERMFGSPMIEAANAYDFANETFLVVNPRINIGSLAYVRTVNGRIRRPAPGNEDAAKALTAANNAFELSDMNGTELTEDGKLPLNGETVLRIKANEPDAYGVLCIENADGTVEEYPIHSMDEHECETNGEYFLVAAPSNGNAGLAVQTCEKCGAIAESKAINAKASAMLSSGETFADIRVAVEKAVEAGKETELSLFGNVNVTADVTIPDYINVLIAPKTAITLADGCKLIAKGTVKDFSGYNYDLSGNKPVVTTTTTTKPVTATTTTTTAKPVTTTNTTTTAKPVTTTNTTTTAEPVTTTTTAEPVTTTTTTTTAEPVTTTTTTTTAEPVTTTTASTTVIVPVTTDVTPAEPVNYGEINGDGVIDASDATLILVQYTYLSTGEKGIFTAEQTAAADINGDGMVDSVDASLVLAYYAYLSTENETKPIIEYLTDAKYIKAKSSDKK